MIPQIKELNFPSYATISTATVTLNDMGEKTISAQVKIDGRITPDFSYDWEIEFQGETYIHPLREPQASKGNDSLYSAIDLTFYHKTIYELKRYYFVEMASNESGTAIVDKYIASLGVNLKSFCDAFANVLNHYFDGTITIDLNPQWGYDVEPSYMDISYTHIWDVLLNLYEVYGVRWTIEGREIKIGYPTEEVSHTFEYGFEGGLLKVERQVQAPQISNSLLGRGGERNLPYRYFKDVDEDNPSFKADPDWIPELANIYFSELRGKTFRDYVKGWKAKHYGGVPMSEPTEEYMKGYSDEKFNPIEYVDDKESIQKYGLLQNGLENVEDIFPTIQGVEVDGIGRVDEIVGVENILVDEISNNTNTSDDKYSQEIKGTYTEQLANIDSNSTKHCVFRTDTFEVTDPNIVPYLVSSPNIEAIWHVGSATVRCYGTKYDKCSRYEGTSKYELKFLNLSTSLYFAESEEQVLDISKLQNGVKYYIKAECDVTGFPKDSDFLEYDGNNNTWRGYAFEVEKEGTLNINYSWVVKNIPYNGLVLKSDESNTQTISIAKNSSKTVTFTTDTFDVPKSGATQVDVPINIVTSAQGLYTYATTTKAVNAITGEIVSAINIPEGQYFLRVSVEITNNSSKTESFKVERLSAYVIMPTDTKEFKPTFDIWIKNVWNTKREDGESDIAYTNRVWSPILGDREKNDAKVVFSTGWLSGHSDYEFTIADIAYAGSEGVEYGGVPAEWRLTLYKSDAEIEATGKWIPSTTQQAIVGDKFFFIGIDMPHQYVLWAEEKLDQYKRDKLLETANIKPTWVVQTDKVRLHQNINGKKLLDSFKVGNTIRLVDKRFIDSPYETLYLQGITYTWDAKTTILPNVEIVLSDKVTTSANPVAMLQNEVNVLSKQVGSISNIQQIIRAIGDKLYLRKDGIEDFSNSTTSFNSQINSQGYRQGAIGGAGWGLRNEQNKGIIECDKLIVRNEMQVNSLVANQVSAIGGKEILSAASITCTKVEMDGSNFKCYFDQKRGSIANLFQTHDIAYSQVFNSQNVEIKYYKREVINFGDNYILLSGQGDGNGEPQEGDVIVQYGNTIDPNRQYVIIRDVVGGGHERMLSNLDSIDAIGVEYYFAGRIENGTPRWFVGDAQGDYVEWKNGILSIKGKLDIGSDVGGATIVEGGLVTAETIALGGNETKAGITGKNEGDNAIRIWAGASEENAQDAPFRVRQDGKLISTDAEIKGHINAESGTFGKGAYAFNIGSISQGGLAIPSIENNATDASRMTIVPYYIEYSAKREEFDNTTGEITYKEYGTNVKMGAQLGDGFRTSNQMQIVTCDNLDNTFPLSHNASINISAYGLQPFAGIGGEGETFGNHALMIEKGNICGLRVQTRRFTDNGQQLSKYDTMVIVDATLTLTLPADAEDGQLYFIKPNSGTTTIKVASDSGHKIRSAKTNVSSRELSSGAINMFVFDVVNQVWHHSFLQNS